MSAATFAGAASPFDTSAFAEEYPWDSKYLDVDAGKLAYLDEGPKDGPVLLMLHGNPTWSFLYREGYVQRWLRHLGGARVTRPREASHYLQEDAPEAVADAIRRVREEASS